MLPRWRNHVLKDVGPFRLVPSPTLPSPPSLIFPPLPLEVRIAGVRNATVGKFVQICMRFGAFLKHFAQIDPSWLRNTGKQYLSRFT